MSFQVFDAAFADVERLGCRDLLWGPKADPCLNIWKLVPLKRWRSLARK